MPGTLPDRGDRTGRQRVVGGRALILLTLTACLAALAAGAELWRYGLLLRSRGEALSAGTVLAADVLAVTVSVFLLLVALAALAASFVWLLHARIAAAAAAGVHPPRTPLRIAVCLFLPGANWVLAGPVAAELEHLAASASVTRRPRPSRLVLAWWAAWVTSGVLLAVTVLWRTRDGVQAQADGVLLTALTNLAAVVLAALTAVLIQRIIRLLDPSPAGWRGQRVAAVRDAPDPPLRAHRPAHARR